MKSSKILLASLLGNILEYYEFTIFAVFAVQIADTFFANTDDFTRILRTLGLFTAGFISRPIGSLIFGHIGDKFGRRTSLILTITGMSGATLAIAATPNYVTIGVTAPIILLILRLLQGLCIGGEGAGSAIYVLEHELKVKKGVIGGILISSNVAGVLLASIVGLVINGTIGLNAHSWRLAFILGGIMGLIVSYMRLTLPETAVYSKVDVAQRLKAPVARLFSRYWREVIVVIALGGLSSGVAYIVKGFLVIHFQTFMGLPAETAFLYLTFTSAVFAVLPPILGYISDRYQLRKFIQAITLLIVLLFIPVFLLISTTSVALTLLGLSMLAILAAAICTPIYIYVPYMFPTEVRYSGVAISYNLGVTFLAGFTTIIATYLTETTKIAFAPALYIIALALIYLISDHVLHKKLNNS